MKHRKKRGGLKINEGGNIDSDDAETLRNYKCDICEGALIYLRSNMFGFYGKCMKCEKTKYINRP